MDGENVVSLIPRISSTISGTFPYTKLNILVVNDNSTPDLGLTRDNFSSRGYGFEVLELGKNVGNQKAILAGLSKIEEKCANEDVIVVMDSDGEDLPEDIPTLINALKHTGTSLIVASRKRREANWRFLFGLKLFSLFFKILTGSTWNSGNFSCFRGRWLKLHLKDLEVAGNFAGFLRHQVDEQEMVALNRGERIGGQTRTSFTSLINHAIDCLLFWHAEMRIRALLFFTGNLAFLLFTLMVGVFFQIGPYQTTPNWITLIFYGSMTITLLAFSLFFSALILSISEKKLYSGSRTVQKKK